MKPKKDKDLIAHVSLFGATVLDRILDNRKLPFLGGGPAVMRETLDELKQFKLIQENTIRLSGYVLTKKGYDVCRALWGDNDDHEFPSLVQALCDGKRP